MSVVCSAEMVVVVVVLAGKVACDVNAVRSTSLDEASLCTICVGGVDDEGEDEQGAGSGGVE